MKLILYKYFYYKKSYIYIKKSKKLNKMLHIVNYIIKIAIIIIGIIFISGIIPAPNNDNTLFRVMGGVFILFGIYRIVLYRMKYKEYNFKKSEEEKDEE